MTAHQNASESPDGPVGQSLGEAPGSAWRECAKAWRKVADDMYDADQELARRAMARAETFEYCANTLETETPNDRI